MSKPIEEILAEGGIYVGTTKGVSMRPMMREGRDTVAVKPLAGRAKKYDVVLYRRGESYVFHRVVKVLPESYVICGDNCHRKEYGIKDADLLGVLCEFYRGEKKIKLDGLGYRFYCRLILPLRPVKMFCKRVGGAILRGLRLQKKKD